MAGTPMFPLGTVLLPGMVLPLHIFEERYRQMTRDCLAGDRRFGVVLIERGREVGGGEVRSAVGTMAEIVRAEEQPDGRWGLIAVGTERIRIATWLDDDPYPLAEVEPWPDFAAEDGRGVGTQAGGRAAAVPSVDDVVVLVRRARAMAIELGAAGGPMPEVADDPVTAGWQLGLLAPLGAHDRQRLLTTDTATGRLTLLHELVTDEIEVLGAQLGG